MTALLTTKEEEVLAMLILGPLTLHELTELVAGGEAVIRAALDDLHARGRVRLDATRYSATETFKKAKRGTASVVDK